MPNLYTIDQVTMYKGVMIERDTNIVKENYDTVLI